MTNFGNGRQFHSNYVVRVSTCPVSYSYPVIITGNIYPKEYEVVKIGSQINMRGNWFNKYLKKQSIVLHFQVMPFERI